MNQRSHALVAYRRTRLGSASPARLMLMLFENAALRLDRAREAALESDRKALGQACHYVRAVYIELLGALDASLAPELVARLAPLYRWCIEELVVAERSCAPERVGAVARVNATLLDGWREAVEEAAR